MAWNLSNPSQQFTDLQVEPTSYILDRLKPDSGPNSKHKTNFNILPKLKQFRDENMFCDIEIMAGNQIFQGHKVVLASWSPYFSSLLDPQLRTAKESLLVEHLDSDVISEFLEFLYTGDIYPKENNVTDMLGLAKELQIKSLTFLCEEYLCNTISVNNFVNRLLTSHKYDLKGLAEKVIQFGHQNLSTVVKQREFLNLPPVKFYQLLNFLKLSQSNLEVKLGLISHWVGYNIEEREKLVLHLLSGIEWTSSPSDIIRFITSSENLFTANECCLYQLMHRLYMSFQHLGPYINTYESLHLIYKDIIDQDFPRLLSESQKLDDIQFKVTVQASSSHKHLSDANSQVKKDANINTDIDNTYFDEITLPDAGVSSHCTEIEPALVKEEVASADDIEKVTDVCERVIAVNLDSDRNAQGTVNETVVEVDKKHSRRKGNPRKHSKVIDGAGFEVNDMKKIKTEKKNVVKSRRTVIGKSEKGKLKIKIKALQPKKEKLDSENEGLGSVKMEKVEYDTIDANSDTDHYMSDVEKPSEELTEERNVVDSNFKVSGKKLKLKASRTSVFKSKQVIGKVKAKRPDTRPSRMKGRPFIKCTEEDCNYQTKNEKYMARHVDLVHNMNIKLKCKHCDFSASLMRDLCLHSKKHYPDGPPYICHEKDCNFRAARMGLLIRHFMEHSNERPYVCDICDKSFRTLNQQSCHKKLHEGRQYVCDVCNKRFTTKGGMMTHRAIHFDNKPYLCDWCGFSTKHQSHLISHRKLHTGEVKRCTFPNCNYTTPKTGHMTQHMNCHLNIRNHICQVCGKAFVVRSKLLRHEKIHLEEKLFKCKSCDYKTSRTDRMKLHIQSHCGPLRRKGGGKFAKMAFEEEFDFHKMYEKIEPSSNSFYSKSVGDQSALDNNANSGIVEGITSIAELGSESITNPSTDPIQMPFSQNTYRQLDLLSVAAAGLEQFTKMQEGGYQPPYEPHHGTSYEQM